MERNKCVSAGGNHSVGKDACQVCVCGFPDTESITAYLQQEKTSVHPSPTLHSVLAVREESLLSAWSEMLC